MTIRGLALLITSGVLGQSIAAPKAFLASQKSFLHAVDALQSRMVDGQPIDPLLRVQEEIGLSPVSAQAVFATVSAYNEQADKVESALRSSILTRRLQVAGGFVVTYSSELDVVNWANLDLNLFLVEQMDDLHSRLSEEESQRLVRFIEDRAASDSFFPLRQGETGPAGSTTIAGWKQSPLGFWRDSIKAPLSNPEAESLFIEKYRDVAFPPEDVVYYLEGTVVSVTPEDSQGRKVLLSMRGDGPADAALLIDGMDWELTSQPKKGTIVRFTGVAREFTREPFLILFSPERITGLPVATSKQNPPFSNPGLSR
jgi:hypothetical protein